jgi:hypothetical protein
MKLRSFLPLIAAIAVIGRAYPPAPDHVLYGTVRDEFGRVLPAGAGIVIVSGAAGEIVRCPIDDGLEPGVNYTVRLPMDTGTLGGLYRPTALLPTVGFTIRVVRNNISYVPIEVSRIPPTIGLPGLRTRLDLTLGVDTVGDGLPDAWKQALIDRDTTGRLKKLSDVRPGDDLDGDGLTNLQEFLLGTYPLDQADALKLTIIETVSGYAHLRFAVVAGRTYSIRGSSDLQSWVPQAFSVGTAGTSAVNSFAATSITVLDVWVSLPPGGTAFYRLYVQ